MSSPDVAVAEGDARVFRFLAWGTVGLTFAYLIENFMVFGAGWTPALAIFAGSFSVTGLLLAVLYIISLAAPAWLVMRDSGPGLRMESERLNGIVTYFIRACFWSVLLIGLADMLISFLRVEEMLADFVGEDLAAKLNFNSNRAPIVHIPLIGLSFVIAAVVRGIGFHWLALLIVMAEVQIVLSRFVFSYEQAFMGDLVRFWYGALFLFASAYTLREDGHVRVDVLYAGFRDRTKGRINTIGSILLGILFCWVVIVMGMHTKSSVINGPVFSLEVSQSGFGMYVKYLMAGFLGIFAVSMQIQFCAYMLESVADWRGLPGSRLHEHDDELPGA